MVYAKFWNLFWRNICYAIGTFRPASKLPNELVIVMDPRPDNPFPRRCLSHFLYWLDQVYIGETGKFLVIIKEEQRDVTSKKVISTMVGEHAQKQQHNIEGENTTFLFKQQNVTWRLLLESSLIQTHLIRWIGIDGCCKKPRPSDFFTANAQKVDISFRGIVKVLHSWQRFVFSFEWRFDKSCTVELFFIRISEEVMTVFVGRNRTIYCAFSVDIEYLCCSLPRVSRNTGGLSVETFLQLLLSLCPAKLFLSSTVFFHMGRSCA